MNEEEAFWFRPWVYLEVMPAPDVYWEVSNFCPIHIQAIHYHWLPHLLFLWVSIISSITVTALLDTPLQYRLGVNIISTPYITLVPCGLFMGSVLSQESLSRPFWTLLYSTGWGSASCMYPHPFNFVTHINSVLSVCVKEVIVDFYIAEALCITVVLVFECGEYVCCWIVDVICILV